MDSDTPDTVSFEHLAQHGVPLKDIELIGHWFDSFPAEVNDPQLAMVWALEVLPWERSRALLATAFEAARNAPGVIVNDSRLDAVAKLLGPDKVDEAAAQRASEACYAVVDVYARMYGLDDNQEDGGERVNQALMRVVLNPKIDPTVRLWVGALPTIGAALASTFGSKVEDSDHVLARSVYSALFTLLAPPKTSSPRERVECINGMLQLIYAELASYLSTWARPWGT